MVEVLDLKNVFLRGKAISCTRITYSQRRQYTTQLFVPQRGHHEKIYSVPKDHRTSANTLALTRVDETDSFSELFLNASAEI